MIGRTLGHYRISRELGAGGMGEVFLAEDTILERKVALKLLPEAALRDPVARERFSREAKSAAALDNPFICKIYETGEAEGQVFIAMEYVEGGTLRDRLDERTPSPEESLRIAVEVAEALQVAHEHNIIHRDFKPSNLLLTPEGHAKVSDFGLAKRLFDAEDVDPLAETAQAEELTQWGTTVGTLAYMSPEQIRGNPLQPASDIFSFGVVLYEMLTGRHPFSRSSTADTINAILHSDPAPLEDSLQLHQADALQRILDKSLDKDPARRYQTAGDLITDLRSIYRQAVSGPRPAFRELLQQARRPQVWLTVSVIAVLLIALIFWSLRARSTERWANEVAIPEVEALIENDDYLTAFDRAEQIEQLVGESDALQALWPRMSQSLSITTTPAGARVYFRPWSKVEVEERYLGETPLANQRVPLGLYWLRIEKDGYEAIDGLYRGVDHYESPETGKDYSYSLVEEGNLADGMVRIPGSTVEIKNPLLPSLTVDLPPYLIDSHEVTNAEFQAFVDAGGYRNPEYWQHEFVKDGTVLSFEEAIQEFRDRTDRPGPSTWEVGTFPEGEEEYPVSGVSWYEAAAYARFVGKSLPTLFHWIGATDLWLETYITPHSNFSDEGPRPVAAARPDLFGTYDMAGNVKEWCENPSQDRRFILGGGWKERTYAFSQIDMQPPFTRSDTYGFRCVRYLESDEATLAELGRPIPPQERASFFQKPVSDEILQAYMTQYEYDPTDLDAVVESVDESSDYWVRERISLNAPYEGERLIAYLFRPRNVESPFQTVVFFPGSGARQHDSIEGQIRMFDFLVKSGRAVMYPIYKGTIERREGHERGEAGSRKYAQNIIQWVNEVRRSIDYLATRPDIDMDRLTYYGFSWGARLAPIVLALDSRPRLAVLLDGGLDDEVARPEVLEVNYAPRVQVPVLMINGTDDVVFPVETSQKALLSLLGTPDEDKRHILYESGHCVIGFWRNQVVRDILNWLDEHLGPVTAGT